jgi:outer membrane protein assembly factor BamB
VTVPTATNTTYLELSEEGGGAHKYYEVVVRDCDVTITYGRIGAPGQTRTTTLATPDKAASFAAKKIGEKVKKGYETAVRGVRQARPVTRRQIVSQRSTASRAPMLWRFKTGASAFGIFVDDHRVMAGNQRGDVWTLDHSGAVTGRFALPDGVKCLVADSYWVYAGCDDGQVYDLSGKMPHVAYEVAADVDIYWMDINNGTLGVSDADGNLVTVDEEDDFQWRRKSPGSSGWMIRCDGDGVYHGHSKGVDRYQAGTGAPVWSTPLPGSVLFGWQEPDAVFAGTSARAVHRLDKDTGRIAATYRCDAAVYSCATSPGGELVFAGDSSSSVYCFTADGTRLWKLATGCGSAFSMQYHDDRLFLVTTDGSLACLDVSQAAVEQAGRGVLPTTATVKDTGVQAVAPSTALATVNEVEIETSGGVVVECIEEGSRVRVRVVSPGFDPTMRVQFPKRIRQAGSRYLVTEIVPASNGAFYRVRGDIRRVL